jgi:hypothetical protein
MIMQGDKIGGKFGLHKGYWKCTKIFGQETSKETACKLDLSADVK